jgi:ElaB/YqjD/DUF883 family membrane-anchored ribosome-binding protein
MGVSKIFEKSNERKTMIANAERSEKLVTDLNQVVLDSEKLLRDSHEVAGEKAHELRARLARTLGSAKVACRGLEKKAKEGAKVTDQVIRDHPYQSIGIALGLGVLVGALAMRK